jgi:LmbE family N-acetylglucosaminyl deacetylase
MNVFLSPHNDDETLFGAFTILRERPLVVVVFKGHPRSGDPALRQWESECAMTMLDRPDFEQWPIEQEPEGIRLVSSPKLHELEEAFRALDAREHPEKVWAPALSPCGNVEHVAVGSVANTVFGSRVVHYHTYHGGKKVQSGKPVDFQPKWLEAKHRALACYGSQFGRGARVWFMSDLYEWYA